MSDPVICFGQQPNGFFPKRFFYSKVVTARRLRDELGGRIVYRFTGDRADILTVVHAARLLPDLGDAG